MMLSSEQPVLAGQIFQTELVNVRCIWYIRNTYRGREGASSLLMLACLEDKRAARKLNILSFNL